MIVDYVDHVNKITCMLIFVKKFSFTLPITPDINMSTKSTPEQLQVLIDDLDAVVSASISDNTFKTFFPRNNLEL